MAAEKLGDEEPDDPWRDPRRRPRWALRRSWSLPAARRDAAGKLGVRDVLFGGKVSYRRPGDPRRHVALLVGIARRLGRPKDGRGGGGVHHLRSPCHQPAANSCPWAGSPGGRVGGRLGGHHRSHQQRSGSQGRVWSSTGAATSSPTTTSSPMPPTNPPVQDHRRVQRRQGSAGQPGRPGPEDRPGGAEGRQRRQPHGRQARRLRQGARRRRGHRRGRPLGLRSTVTHGIISALHRPVPLSGDGSTPTPSSTPFRPTRRSTTATPAAR